MPDRPAAPQYGDAGDPVQGGVVGPARGAAAHSPAYQPHPDETRTSQITGGLRSGGQDRLDVPDRP